MTVLERQYGILSDLDFGEIDYFVDYKVTAAFLHKGVCYNWNAAGDLKNYTGTTEQWVAIQGAIEEIKNYGTIIIATYLSANNETVRLKLNDKGDLYFIGPDGSINTITASGMYIEESGGKAIADIFRGFFRSAKDAKYNDCSKYDVLKGAINYNWDKAGLLKDYDGTTWYALDAAKADMKENGTIYLATYDDTTLVKLYVDSNNEMCYITPSGTTIVLRDPSVTSVSAGEDSALSKELVFGYSRRKYPYATALGTHLHFYPSAIEISGITYEAPNTVSLDIDDSGNWDEETYAIAENRAGKDVYFYACTPTVGTVPTYIFSINSTVPTGFTASNSRKIGGFHCECVNIPAETTWVSYYDGTTSPHNLAGLLAGYILPTSIWDLYHRPLADPVGMIWCESVHIWCDIYLAGWDGQKLVSQFNATTADGTYPDINPLFGNKGFDNETFQILSRSVDKRVITRVEFLAIAEGSNERTSIKDTKDWVITGGHVDTANRRMVSNVGCEDCCGFLEQYTSDFAAAGGSSWNYGYIYAGNNYNLSARGSCLGVLYALMVGQHWGCTYRAGSSSLETDHHCAVRGDANLGARLVSLPLHTRSASSLGEVASVPWNILSKSVNKSIN